LNEGRRKKEKGIRRFIYVDLDPNSKGATCVLVSGLKRTARINYAYYRLPYFAALSLLRKIA
jgi:hypothetical protein